MVRARASTYVQYTYVSSRDTAEQQISTWLPANDRAWSPRSDIFDPGQRLFVSPSANPPDRLRLSSRLKLPSFSFRGNTSFVIVHADLVALSATREIRIARCRWCKWRFLRRRVFRVAAAISRDGMPVIIDERKCSCMPRNVTRVPATRTNHFFLRSRTCSRKRKAEKFYHRSMRRNTYCR